MIAQPEWIVPANLREIVAEEEVWESSSWDPIELSVWGGATYKGREIALSWQVEFDPEDDRILPATKHLAELELPADGYGWATLIKAAIDRHHPEIAEEVQLGDADESTLVAWVESETSCLTLMQLVWKLIHAQR